MELNHLRAFLVVAEELHFGKAAERLHVTQPPLSRMIQQLERDLGAKLFERSTRSVRLTSAGEALLEPARDVLTGCRLAEQAVRSAAMGESGRVRLGFAGPSSYLWIADLSRAIRQRHPGISLELQSTMYADQGLRMVLEGTLDLALARLGIEPAGIRHRIIAEEHYVLAVPEGHRFADRELVSLAECCDEAFVTLPASSGSSVREALFRFAYDAGFAPDVAQTAPDSWTLLALVGAGVGITFTTDTTYESYEHPRVRMVRVREGIDPTYARLLWRADDGNPALHAVLRAAEELGTAVDGSESGAELDQADLTR
jgi:DNA-binding transcriptional LysR family regulator